MYNVCFPLGLIHILYLTRPAGTTRSYEAAEELYISEEDNNKVTFLLRPRLFPLLIHLPPNGEK